MQFLRAFLLIVLLGLMVVPTAFAAADGEELDPVHHTADGYYLDFQPIGKVELPRIFLVRDAEGSLGLDFFGSTAAALRSGKYVPELEHEVAEGEHVTEEEAHTAETIDGLIGSGAHLDAHLAPVEGSMVIDFSITRHLVFAIFASLLLILAFSRLAARYKRGVGRETAPKGLWQNLLETLIVFVRDDIAKPNLGDKYLKFLPFLLTVFFFILLCNLLGLVPFGATATSNLMITAVLATFTFFLTQINGSKDHWKHVFWPPGVPVLVKPILIPVEIMGLFTKPIALAIRLFANMTAGHLVILSLIGLIFTFNSLFGAGMAYAVSPVSIAFALFVSLLEILIAFIQAYIFTILSALFIGMAIAEHEHEHDAHGHEEVGQASLPDLEDEGYHTPIIGDGEESREAVPATPKLATAG
ncbi:MAG TPA: F0F1 ATP synthase subunit A [Rhodothermales bacterium]|nr:F0F1 ATP synthase subunit A [Rhodothermales bacterium]